MPKVGLKSDKKNEKKKAPRVRSGRGFLCPECSQPLGARSSNKVTETMTERYYLCLTPECGVKSLRSVEEISVIKTAA